MPTVSQLGTIAGYNALTLLPAAASGATIGSLVLSSGSGTSVSGQIHALSAPHLVTPDNITTHITRAQDIYVPVDT